MSAKEFRLGIGASILKEMDENEDLPLPNKHRLAKVMMEYFDRGGYEDDLKEAGYTWRPDVDYWTWSLKGIRRELRQEGLYFEYAREDGSFKGQWQFANKHEFKKTMRREAAGLSTSVENYNERLEEGQTKWQLDLPAFSEPPLLPPPIH